MFIEHGISVAGWARIEASCPAQYEIVGDEMHLDFGRNHTSLNLVITDEAVDKLAALFAEARASLKERKRCEPSLPTEYADRV